ncbi:MAG: hypothetical protein WAU11_05295 [Ignavibacteriaceae bacterium]
MKNTFKEIKAPTTPNQVFSDFIYSLEMFDDKYFATLPYKGKGYKVQIDLKTFEDIKNYWDENESVLIVFNGGQIENENVIINSTFSISKAEPDTLFI